MSFRFNREPESGLIIVNLVVNDKFELEMVLDTGATHTTIDSNALYLSGYNLSERIGNVEINSYTRLKSFFSLFNL